MKNMEQVLKALLDGKKVVNSSLPGYLYICLNHNILCGSSIDDDYQEESVSPLQNNIFLINNPECYSLYFPYNIGDKLNEMVIVAITDYNIYLEDINGCAEVISREEVMKHI